ncbi:MAG: PASTA domain-containing protein [Candidatus Aminicenantes bacterium]
MSPKRLYDYIFYFLLLLVIFFLSANISYQIVLKGEMVSVPDVMGKTLDEARTELAKKKLLLVQKGTQFDSRWERGRIIFQQPSPGSKIKINNMVRVVLSAGSEKVVVPDLIGKNLQSVDSLIHEAGLRKGSISQVHTPRYAAGKIIAQQPQPRQEIGRDSRINFLVSQGKREKRYLMPDLIGKRAHKVIEKLERMEFRVEDLRYSYYPGLESGIIIKQFPPQGFRIQKRNLITLEVSK